MIGLGDKVKDIVTGLVGIATSRTEYLNGCIRIGVQPPIADDGKVPECQWVDETQLKVLKRSAVKGRVDTPRRHGDRPGPAGMANPPV